MKFLFLLLTACNAVRGIMHTENEGSSNMEKLCLKKKSKERRVLIEN